MLGFSETCSYSNYSSGAFPKCAAQQKGQNILGLLVACTGNVFNLSSVLGPVTHVHVCLGELDLLLLHVPLRLVAVVRRRRSLAD